jgi:hypothetical protein
MDAEENMLVELAASHSLTIRRLSAALLLAAVMAPRGVVAQTALASIPEVNGRVVGLRFFATYGPAPKRTVRVYGNRFDAAATRYVNTELEIDFPAPGRVVEFSVVCQYTKPDGGTMGPLDMKFTVQPNWVGSVHQNGWGAQNPGTFAPGAYKVRCTSGNNVVAEGAFEVLAPAAEVPAAQAKFTGIRFFETPKEIVAAEQRQYSQVFEAAQSRYVAIELSFTRPANAPVAEFTTNCNIFKPDGTSFGQVTLRFAPRAEWTAFINAGQWGYETPGHWAKGVYRVACTTDGRWIADSAFEVV